MRIGDSNLFLVYLVYMILPQKQNPHPKLKIDVPEHFLAKLVNLYAHFWYYPKRMSEKITGGRPPLTEFSVKSGRLGTIERHKKL